MRSQLRLQERNGIDSAGDTETGRPPEPPPVVIPIGPVVGDAPFAKRSYALTPVAKLAAIGFRAGVYGVFSPPTLQTGQRVIALVSSANEVELEIEGDVKIFGDIAKVVLGDDGDLVTLTWGTNSYVATGAEAAAFNTFLRGYEGKTLTFQIGPEGVPAPPPAPEPQTFPWDSFTTHAEFDAWAEDNNVECGGSGWDRLTLAGKRDWLVAYFDGTRPWEAAQE